MLCVICCLLRVLCLMPKLTRREYAVFSCVRQFMSDSDRSPTRREVGEMLGIMPQTVHGHLKNLAQKKFVLLTPHKIHNIRLLRREYRRQPKLL